MNISEGLLAAAVGWIITMTAGVFGYGKLSQKVDENTRDIGELKDHNMPARMASLETSTKIAAAASERTEEKVDRVLTFLAENCGGARGCE